MKWILSRRDNLLVEKDTDQNPNPVGMTFRQQIQDYRTVAPLGLYKMIA